jgi:bifunctional UDP-N-acetylglucosamine pyrophosphorylase/glucosamine-1-phosphate N-acetyltransferase
VVTSAIVLAAGKGTRMRSDRPKVLHPLRGEPLVVHVVRTALAAGADAVVVVVGVGGERVREAVESAFARERSRLRFAEQTQQLGTGHAVSCALPELAPAPGIAAILAGDVPLVKARTIAGLLAAASHATARLAFATFTPDDNTGYGRVVRGPNGGVVAIREERDASPQERAIAECNAGLYAVDVDVLRSELPRVGRANAQGEIYLTDLVAACARAGEVATVTIDAIEAAGVNTLDQLAALERTFT